MQAVIPTGARHEVDVDDIFFSTTDARGVIEQSNGVFVRMSHYAHDQLVGAPHNLIRHPEMPGGAFKVMWDTLQAGKPFTAYVRNLAANGSEYCVYATITPLADGGYLSVRMRPNREDLFETALAIYQQTRAYEDGLLTDGYNRRQAAEAGASKLAQLLASGGIPTYDDLQNFALPAEVAAHEARSSGFPYRPAARGELRAILDDVHGAYQELDAWMAQQEKLTKLADSLKQVGQRLAGELDGTNVTAETIGVLSAAGTRYASLIQPLELWMQMQGIVSSSVKRLRATLTRLESNSIDTRFRVALARLHTTMMANFTAELIDGDEYSDYSLPAISTLTSALRQGIAQMDEQTAMHARLTADTAASIAQTMSIMSIPRELLMLWQQTAGQSVLPREVAAVVPAITERIDRAGDAVSELDRLAKQCRDIRRHDSTRLLSAVRRIGERANLLAG
ncbi:MAG: PAS domain-containing protein [Bowdeniella nasicola]|nr:PAS domain-containing protein [Bowdeniella nasicola]